MDFSQHVHRERNGSWKVVVELPHPLVARGGFASEAAALEFVAAQISLLKEDADDLCEVSDPRLGHWIERGGVPQG